MNKLILLDFFLHAAHLALIVFNLFGWIFPATRRLNLYCLLLTAFSWLVLGIWYGIGYCPLTDWHYQVKFALGQNDLPPSYIALLIYRLTPLRPSYFVVDVLTAVAFGLALIFSITANVRDRKRGK